MSLLDLMPEQVRNCPRHAHIIRTIEEVTFPGYRFTALPRERGGFTVFARFKAPCSVEGGEPRDWTTRKWVIGEYATTSEVVGTLLKIVLTSVEHEARENFKWQGVAVFDPHVSVEALKVAVQTKDVRT